jgi:phenylacetate-CoA ligase
MNTYPLIFQKIIFPIIEMMEHTSINKKLVFLNKSQFFSKKQIEDYQNMRLRHLIKHAYTQVPYYRKLFDSLNLKPESIKTKKDLDKIPFLTKSIINLNKEEFRAKNYLNSSYAKFTSGSTGEPTKFYQTKEDFSWIWAAHFRAWGWAGYTPGKKYIKISINDDRHLFKKKLQDMLFRSKYILIEKLQSEDIKKYVDAIIKYKPTTIYGYSSSLNIISDYMSENNIFHKVKSIITTGDNLLPNFRKTIEKQFLCDVFDEYGCGGEGLPIAQQCCEGTYHMNDELMISEVINNELYITSLNNYAMPLIRYKIGDFVTINPDCKCGRHLSSLKSIDGRSHDIVRTKKGVRLVVHFFTVLFEYLEGINKFKVIQNDITGIKIQMVVDNKYSKKETEDKIIYAIQNAAGKNFDIRFEYLDEIPLEKTGKQKLIASKLND